MQDASRSGKNLILLFDGTGDKPGKHETNVIKTAELLSNHQKQLIFYDPGVGTKNEVTTHFRPWKNKIGGILGKLFGYGIQKNILEGYEFLMRHYQKGDHVYILGFSRGAFTARTAADCLAKFGVLTEGNGNLLPYLLDNYFARKAPDPFWQNMTIPCTPHFVGVWDTVGTLGHLLQKRFFNHTLHPQIPFGCHAVAIDEKRKYFLPWLWDLSDMGQNQQILQVYFIGVHSDVGGWYQERGLSHITLKWMLENAKRAGAHLRPNWQQQLSPNPNGKLHQSKTFLWKCLELIDVRQWGKNALRTIAPDAKIHFSVSKRDNYHPKNLNLADPDLALGEHVFKAPEVSDAYLSRTG